MKDILLNLSTLFKLSLVWNVQKFHVVFICRANGILLATEQSQNEYVVHTMVGGDIDRAKVPPTTMKKSDFICFCLFNRCVLLAHTGVDAPIINSFFQKAFFLFLLFLVRQFSLFLFVLFVCSQRIILRIFWKLFFVCILLFWMVVDCRKFTHKHLAGRKSRKIVNNGPVVKYFCGYFILFLFFCYFSLSAVFYFEYSGLIQMNIQEERPRTIALHVAVAGKL